MAVDPTAQDIIRCELCTEKPVPSPVDVVCNTCDINLCNECLAKHVSTKLSIKHDIVGFRFKRDVLTVSCQSHSDLKCDVHCKKCHIPLCPKCLSSGSHKNHDVVEISDVVNSQKQIIENDAEGLENLVVPIYENISSELQTKVLELLKGYESLKKSILQQGRELHEEVDIVIKKNLTMAKHMKRDDLAMLRKLQSDINDQLSKVRQTIQENINFLKSNDGTVIMKYKSRLDDFRNIPPSFDLSLPTFSPVKIQGEQIVQMFGKLQPSSKTEIPGYIIDWSKGVYQHNKHFLNKIIVNNIDAPSEMKRVSCVPNTEQCITRSSALMTRFDRKGTEYETVRTKSGNSIYIDLTVTRMGNLVYSDYEDRSINMVQHGKIDTIIRFRGWSPLAVCSTSSDDLLISMVTDDKSQNKVVRYVGSTVTQEIQFDDQHKSLFQCPAFIEENKNLQVCVSDTDKNTVVVTDKSGKLMFRYNGNLSSKKFIPFNPHGLATDSMCHILVADFQNNCIHIITHEGRFLGYIDNCALDKPLDVSISGDDILYIVDFTTKVKLIKYLQ